MTRQSYAIGLGSNRRDGRHGAPERVIGGALAAMEAAGINVTRRSRTIATPPLGPGGRRYANAAALIETALAPPALLEALKAIERHFGRRGGRRWGARVIDLDILLWSGGRWRSRRLTVPHVGLAKRDFVLRPLGEIAPRWREPVGQLTVAALAARLRKPARR